MGDVDEGEADLGLDALEFDLHLTTQLEVEGAQRLVEQQHLGLVHERARHRHALLLTTRQLLRLALGQVRQLHQLQRRISLCKSVLHSPTLRTEGHVVAHGEVREQCVRLEHGVDRALVGPTAGEVGVADEHAARGGLLESGDHA